MENKKSNGGLIIFLVIIILILTSFIIYDKFISNNNINNDTEINEEKKEKNEEAKEEIKTYDYKEVAGSYVYKVSENKEYILILQENGLFEYINSDNAVNSQIGNYHIDNDKIVLNTLFTHGSDASVTVQPNSKELVYQIFSTNEIEGTSYDAFYNTQYDNISLKRENYQRNYYKNIEEELDNSVILKR